MNPTRSYLVTTTRGSGCRKTLIQTANIAYIEEVAGGCNIHVVIRDYDHIVKSADSFDAVRRCIAGLRGDE